MQPISMVTGLTNQEVRAPPSPSFPHTMLSVERVKDNMRLTFIESYLPIVRLRPTWKQDTCASRLCPTRAKTTYVTLDVFSCRMLWPSFSVITHNLR
jgi:hypothetical protein